MFKNVEYIGLDDQPDLKAKAQRANDTLGSVIRSWRDEVEVAWRPAASDSGAALELTATLVLPDASAAATGPIPAPALVSGENASLRMAVREVWLDLLDKLVAQVASRLDESFAAPMGA